ncbi:unnamed protein product [Dovyalis caffra]|uniref:non-specific serine/threonine protein kinase n=1 Tax=Dovyalis caffra TaxID=77055 RepID=A0AAV1S2D6_9ROSI|nr:unnamed protein product [Dovyalis caffra]
MFMINKSWLAPSVFTGLIQEFYTCSAFPSPEMHPHLFQTISLSLTVLTVIIIPKPISLGEPDGRYLSCSSSFECGNIQGVTYPFWGLTRPQYCGHPGFRLDCSGNTPVITISELAYQVLEIKNMSRILKVARKDYKDSICPILPINSTFDLNHFSYASNTKNITLYYACPTIPSQFLPTFGLSNQFNCSISRADMVGYYLTRTLNMSAIDSFAANISRYLESCNYSIIVPAYESAVRPIESHPTAENLIAALAQGFWLQWTANDSLCNKCKFSGGQCGYDTDTSKFTCYCRDQSYANATTCEKGTSCHFYFIVFFGERRLAVLM